MKVNPYRDRWLRRGAAAAALAATAVVALPARAQTLVEEQEVVVVAPPPPAPSLTDVERVNTLDEHTAFTVNRHQLKLGLLAFEFGITDRFSIGTAPPAWAARSVISILFPNLHAKWNFARLPLAVLSAEVAGYYADFGTANASGKLVTIPVNLYSSTPVGSRTWIHLEGNYNYIHAWGSGDITRAGIRGAVATQNLQLGAMVEVRLSRVVALIARGRYQPFSTDVTFNGSSNPDPYTTVQVAAQGHPADPHPWMGIGGVALTWKHVGVVAGGGYGHYFIPGVNLALPYNGFCPEGSLWVTF